MLKNVAILFDSAVSYFGQRKYKQAESLLLRALDISERHYGSEHPDNVEILFQLAASYSRRGKYKQAEVQLQRALTVCQQMSDLEQIQVIQEALAIVAKRTSFINYLSLMVVLFIVIFLPGIALGILYRSIWIFIGSWLACLGPLMIPIIVDEIFKRVKWLPNWIHAFHNRISGRIALLFIIILCFEWFFIGWLFSPWIFSSLKLRYLLQAFGGLCTLFVYVMLTFWVRRLYRKLFQ